MNPEAYRELKVLEELSVNPTLTQRHLAKELQVALGLTNLMIRRLVKKGYVEAVNVKKNRIQYLITPTGIAEKTRLSYEFLEYSLHLYREVRRVLSETLAQALVAGGRRVVFFGVGEVAEIAYVTIKELGLELVGVIDDQAVGKRFLGLPVRPLEDVPRLSFDCGIVSSLDGGLDALQHRLQDLGVPDHKIIVIHRNRHHVHAVIPGLDRLEGTNR